MQKKSMRHRRHLLVALGLSVLGAALPAAAAEPDVRAGERSLTVSASAGVNAEPDLAYFSAGILSDAETVKDALAKASATMTKLIDGLQALGVAAPDLQTSTLSVDPRYTLGKDQRTQTLSGYRVTARLHIVLRDIKRLGEIIDQTGQLGANQIGRVTFEVSNADALKDEARRAAIAKARARADLYAKAAGVQLGEVLRIFEEPAEARLAPLGVQRATAGAIPIEAGSRTLTAEVQVTWALR